MPLNPAALRSMVARWLTDTCVIRDRAAIVFDEDEGTDVLTAGEVVYAGAFRIRPAGGATVVFVGEGPVPQRTHDVWLLWDTVGVKVDQVLTVDSCEDPHMLGRTFTVTDVGGGSDGAYRKLGVVELLDVSEAAVEEVGS